MSSAQGPLVVVDGREVISLSSNDYLGLTHHPRLREAALNAVQRVRRRQRRGPDDRRDDGPPRGARADLAEFKGTEAVLTFQCGFTANTGVIPTITGEGT